MKIKYYLFFVILLNIMFLVGCNSEISPPTIQTVQDQFYDNYEDIIIVTEFMINSGFENIYIHDDSGDMFADMETVTISDSMVSVTVKRLIKNQYNVITKRGNTIYFQQWTRFTDAGCGIAYSIDGVTHPEIQYLTELVPLSENGWYYYVSNT